MCVLSSLKKTTIEERRSPGNEVEKIHYLSKMVNSLHVKGFFVLWLCYHSNKLNLTTVRKSTAKEVVVGLLSFLIVWISDAVNMVLRTKKCVKWRTFDDFLKGVNSILMFFQEKLASLLSKGKPFFGDLEG